jgi:hypothetical protein
VRTDRDIDGDGVLDAVRRVRIRDSDPTKPLREGLLVWRRAPMGGPQDLMIEDRYPLEGRRILVEYRTGSTLSVGRRKSHGQ